MSSYPQEAEGGYVKLVFGEGVIRTYTLSYIDPMDKTITIDFALHSESGPASLWAMQAKPGDTLQMSSPGQAKVLDPTSDWFLIAGDMTALPAIRANLKHLPATAQGHLLLEVTDKQDKRALEISSLPDNLLTHWLVNPHTGIKPVLSDALQALPWLSGTPSVWIAAELEEVLKARTFLRTQPNFKKQKAYISSYWRYGMDEDRHKIEKSKKLDSPNPG